jgi:hypothetical protein
MGPGYSARIARFASRSCSSGRTGSSKLEIQFLRRFLLVRIILFLLSAAIPSPTLAQAQPQTSTHDLDRQEIDSGDSPSPEAGWFTIHNPRKQTVPYAEAQTIYLSACKVVEHEFSRTDPIRPKLTLLLGSDGDRVYYPKREIQLRKWDKFKFAQGVVILAMDTLLSADEKFSLSKLAVVEAEMTVDVRELKNGRTLPNEGPRK